MTLVVVVFVVFMVRRAADNALLLSIDSIATDENDKKIYESVHGR